MNECSASLFGVAEPPDTLHRVPEDAAARTSAVDTRCSVLVQAPAGAGKTSLLTDRFLTLLAEVEEPEEILAITFTRAATAEMRNRVLRALEGAASGGPASPAAQAAMARAQQRGWSLLEQPHRLDIQTIDSLCLRLAHAQPLLARLGGQLQPAEYADSLYVRAARRTLAQLGSGEGELDAALGTLLLRRDNNLGEAERLLADMLRERGAWMGVLPLPASPDVQWRRVREALEAPFKAAHAQVLACLQEAFARTPHLAEELLTLARYAGSNGVSPALLGGLRALPTTIEQWSAVAELLLTTKNEWRRAWNKNSGFPARSTAPDAAAWTARMQGCCSALAAGHSGNRLLDLLCALRELPPCTYTDEQWETVQAVFRVLRRAAAELRVVFAEAGQVDFTEIAQAAETVLRGEGGLLESERKRHLLVDEFQDTSRAQYRLLAELLREWGEGDGRTVFLVGDPLQSIYLFRQAEVALFHETRAHGLPCGDGHRHCCEPLTLTHNFRSHRALVEALNTRLASVFAGASEDTFVAAHAWATDETQPSFTVHAEFISDDDTDSLSHSTAEAREREAQSIVRMLREELAEAAAAEQRGETEYRIAILVRSRTHLAAVLPALRTAGIPFRAVELEPLSEQPEIVDMLSLVRALMHPADRASWLGILRAPWCGLLLRDLHTLAGGDDPELLRLPLPELIPERLPLLTEDGRARAQRLWRAMEAAQATRYTAGNATSFSSWVERTWMELGGHLCLDDTARANVETFLRLLDEVPPDGAALLRRDFALRLEKLCAAPDARTSDRFGVQVMTVHKAKGLGFEVVFVPGLDRPPSKDKPQMLAMMQRMQVRAPGADDAVDELLVAPISDSDGEREPLYAWVSRQKRRREQEELRRLFYVACTRARRRLRLFATLQVKQGEFQPPKKGTLAWAAWPGLEQDFAREFEARTEPLALAAAASPETTQPTYVLERLPSGWRHDSFAEDVAWSRPYPGTTGSSYDRTQFGSSDRRARGTAMHAAMEALAALRGRQAELDEESVRTRVERVAARSLAAAGMEARASAAEIARYALEAAACEAGSWVLARHAEASEESAWQHWDPDGVLRTVRIDRTFLAGPEPGTHGSECLWVLDYKTGSVSEDFSNAEALEQWLAEQKESYRGQLETYGAVLGAARGDDKPVRYALFFAELKRLVWWSGEAA